MEIVIDGSVFTYQKYGGVPRIYSEILPRICELDPTIRFTIALFRGNPIHALPQHPRIRITNQKDFETSIGKILRPWRVWKNVIPKLSNLMLRRSIGDTTKKIWHSTYYFIPSWWQGKAVSTVYDMIHERYPELLSEPWDEDVRRRKKQYIPVSDRIICISETTQEDLLLYIPLKKQILRTIYPASSNVFSGIRRDNSKPAKPFLLYVGKRYLYKGFIEFIQAFSSWSKKNDFAVIVVGENWREEEISLIDQLQLSKKIRLYSDFKDERLADLYQEAAAFVYPSFYEGFGIPLLEAMSSGCLVIASKIPSTLEVAQDVPIYFDSRDAPSIQQALDQVVASNHMADKVEKGIEIGKRFNWEKTSQGYLEVYRELAT